MQPSDEHSSPFKSRSGLARLIAATGYSWKGLVAAVRHEAAFRQELALTLILMPVALWMADSVTELLFLVGSLLLVLIVELINSAIEALADSISLEHHPLLGRAKDLGSAAVFLAVLFAAMVWIGHILADLL